MLLLPLLITCNLLFSYLAFGNTEKIIFLGPATVEIPNISPGLDDLALVTLSPTEPTFRTRLPRAFPTSAGDPGLQSWFLLRGLERGHRYEIRVCWAATVWLPFVQSSYFFVNTWLTNDIRNPRSSCSMCINFNRSSTRLRSSRL